MRIFLPIVTALMLAACSNCCGEGQCPKHGAKSEMGYCEHCATGKGECSCGKEAGHH